MRYRFPSIILSAAAVLISACTTSTPTTSRLELEDGVAIAVPAGFYYKARLAQGKIIGGGPQTFFDTPGLLIVKSTPELTYLFVAQLFAGIKGLGEVALVYGKGPFDLVEIRHSMATDLDSFVEKEEKVAAPASDGNKVVQRVSWSRARSMDIRPSSMRWSS